MLPILGANLGTGKALAGQESTVFRYDPKDQSFTRTSTTLRVDDGFISADKTKLDPASPAYLRVKRSSRGWIQPLEALFTGRRHATLGDQG